MDIRRILKHLATPHWTSRRAFPARTLARIAQAVRRSESLHRGELRFAVEAALAPAALLRGASARQRAEELFGQLRVWDTAENSGVLIYVLLADRRVEIVADRGMAARVAKAEWDDVCRGLEQAYARGDFAAGTLAAIDRITALLALHFPARPENPNELPDAPLVL
ncbi:MAG: TPM domain-containing protein [Rhodocyclaceae bacterium]